MLLSEFRTRMFPSSFRPYPGKQQALSICLGKSASLVGKRREPERSEHTRLSCPEGRQLQGLLPGHHHAACMAAALLLHDR